MRAWGALAVTVAIGASFWGGLAWQRASQRAVAQEQARWIARDRGEGRSLDEVITLAKEHGATLLRDQWSPGTADNFARGPVVQGRTIWVRGDGVIHWETAR